MEDAEYQRPEGRLIAAALAVQPDSVRKVASRIGISDARLRQIVNGYQPVGKGQRVEVIGTAGRLASIARELGIRADQLREAGRPDAASLLEALTGDKSDPRTRTAAKNWRNRESEHIASNFETVLEAVLERLDQIEERLDRLDPEEVSAPAGRPVLEIAAHEEEVPISGEQGESDTP